MSAVSNGVQYVEMRELFVHYLERLADPAWRARNWGEIGPREKGWGSFDDFLNFLYDDSGVLHDPYGSVGYVLKDAREASAIHRLQESIDTGLAGGLDGEGQALEDPSWDQVTQAAREALVVLKASHAI
jgi:hypothetical protein